MPLSNPTKQVAAKALLATVLLSLLAGVAGSRLVPTVPLYWVLLYSLAAATALFVFLTAITVATATFVQFILRKGGTDSHWLWFSSEPRGLVQLRAQARAAKADAMRGKL